MMALFHQTERCHDNGRSAMMLLRCSWVPFLRALFLGVLLSPTVSVSAQAAQGAGSVTARVFICPDGLTLSTVLESTDPSISLASCDPSAGATIAPLLRTTAEDPPKAGDRFAEGVYLWKGLPFGSYEFSGDDVPSGFGDRLITKGNDVAVIDQEHAVVTISRNVPHIERRFYYFASPDLPAGTISLTLYRCPDARNLSPAHCMVMLDPPADRAFLLPDLWTDPLVGAYQSGRAVWHGLPFGIYAIIHSGVLESGEAAAVPELACLSPDRCALVIGPDAPSAQLKLYVFPIPAGARDSDSDEFTDPHELAGGTDPDAALSPGADRGHSEVDSDADHLSDQDEVFYRTDTNNPDTDGDSIPDGKEIAMGSDPVTLPDSDNGRSDRSDD